MTYEILTLLDSGNYVTYNRAVAKMFGSITCAIMLSELVNRYNYHRAQGELRRFQKYEGEWFYFTYDKCEERTCLTRKQQELAIEKLQKEGLIVKQRIGLPAKNHYQINVEAIEQFLKNKTRSDERSQQDSKTKQDVTKGNNCGLPKGASNKEPKEEPQPNMFCPAGAGADNARGVFGSCEPSSHSSHEQQDANKPSQSQKSGPEVESPSEVNKFDESELYGKIVALRNDWTSEEISFAIEEMKKRKHVVNNPLQYLSGIIHNQRKANKKNAQRPKPKGKKKTAINSEDIACQENTSQTEQTQEQNLQEMTEPNEFAKEMAKMEGISVEEYMERQRVRKAEMQKRLR